MAAEPEAHIPAPRAFSVRAYPTETGMNQSDPVFALDMALQEFRRSAAAALQAFESQFPDLYPLSARAFSSQVGSIAHALRLSEYLSTPHKAWGRTPLECLVEGRVDLVHSSLEVRASFDVWGEGAA